MNVIQQTARIDSNRRVLTLERPLPESAGDGRVDITLFILPSAPCREPVRTPPKISKRWGRGSCKHLVTPGSVDRFLAECRADKEQELVYEKRQKEGRAHNAGISV